MGTFHIGTFHIGTVHMGTLARCLNHDLAHVHARSTNSRFHSTSHTRDGTTVPLPQSCCLFVFAEAIGKIRPPGTSIRDKLFPLAGVLNQRSLLMRTLIASA